MFESAAVLNLAQALFAFLVCIIGFLIRESLTAQKAMNEKMALKLDEILTQVNATNGRVGKLEVRADNTDRNVTRVDATLTGWAKDISARMNKFIDRHHGGHEE